MRPETSIYEYVKQGAQKAPDKIAIWFYGKGISYRQLFQRIEAAAARLSGLGVGPGTVVTIRLPNCPQTIIAIYAVAKLGGICNMVHALLPADSLKANMAFTESRILVTGNHMNDGEAIDFTDRLLYADISVDMSRLNRVGYRLLNRSKWPAAGIPLETAEPAPAQNVPEPAALAESCGVYMHSSGSTGEPKTVMLSHAASNHWVEKTKVYFGDIDLSTQVCLSALPYFHALGFQMDMHRVLSCGGTLVLMAKWDSKKAVSFIKKHCVTVMAGVPAMCRGLLKQKSFSGPRIKQLRGLYIGGEKTDAALKNAMDARLGVDGTAVFEGYGLTETASACAVIHPRHYHIDASGYPVDGVTFMVLQDDGKLRSEGVGEFVIGGNCLMMGYLKDPVGTENTFVQWQGQRYFRTGDWGRIDQDGLIYYIERIKNTIIRKGNNIFPVEIEAVIKSVEGVCDACVIGLPDATSQTELVCACVVPQKGFNEATLEKSIEAACKRALPPISWPAKYAYLKELPKNHMAKIDRKMLKQWIV